MLHLWLSLIILIILQEKNINLDNMSYTSVIVPIVVGLIFLVGYKNMVKPDVPDYQRKRKTLKIMGVVLVGIGVLYFILKMLGS